MDLGDIVNPGALPFGKPLDGIRILALEQMQALPYATQLLGRLGAEVVKVESPKGGDMGRGSRPAMTDPNGQPVGATFLRNNLSKRSICIDLKSPEGRQLVLDLAPHFDVIAENSKAGSMARLGLGPDDITAVAPRTIYASVSGFGNTVDTPYRSWPAFAPVIEAMSGMYDMRQRGEDPPVIAPMGALGDIGAGLYAVIGILAALRHRDHTGEGQHVDIAMLDAVVAMTDIVMNFWSLGMDAKQPAPLIMHGFKASDGWFVLQVGRPAQFAALADLLGHHEWADDDRFATQYDWLDRMDDTLRPVIEEWASDKTRSQACATLAGAGLAAGPVLRDAEVVVDPHIAARDMAVAMPRTDEVDQPVLIPGNPVRLSKAAMGPETRIPWLGEHTDEVLSSELGLDATALADLRARGVIA